MRSKQEREWEKDAPTVSGMTTKHHLNQIEVLTKEVSALREILNLLADMEPALLYKYKTLDNHWGVKTWDLAGMRAALEFRRLQAAHQKYATPVVSETKKKEKE